MGWKVWDGHIEVGNLGWILRGGFLGWAVWVSIVRVFLGQGGNKHFNVCDGNLGLMRGQDNVGKKFFVLQNI